MPNHWKNRNAFGWWRTEQDVVADFGLAPFKHNERLLFSYMENDYNGLAIVIFERDDQLYLVKSYLTLLATLHQQWEPQPVTWDEVAQDWSLAHIKPYGARRKLTLLLHEHGVVGKPLYTACGRMFPRQVEEYATATR